MTLEQSKFIRPIDTAVVKLFLECYPDLSLYLHWLLKTKKPEQQTNTFWIPAPENLSKTEDHAPIPIRILKKLYDINVKEKLNAKNDVERRTKFLEVFDWNSTLRSAARRQSVQEILFEYHYIFVRHIMDIGIKLKFKLKLTAIDKKSSYRQNQPMPIHLTADIFAELTLLHKNGMITVLLFSKYASPIYAERKANGKLRLPDD